MSKEDVIRNFIQKNEAEISARMYTAVFAKWHYLYVVRDRSVMGIPRAELSKLLFDCGINFLEYVEDVPTRCFLEADWLEDITLPNNIIGIQDKAFMESSLKTIRFSDNTEYIGSKAFAFCENLESVELPEGLLSIEPGAFRFCDNLKEAYIPDSIEELAQTAFKNCPKVVIKAHDDNDFVKEYCNKNELKFQAV